MTELSISFSDTFGPLWVGRMTSDKLQMRKAATRTMVEAGSRLHARAVVNIKQAGFGKRWWAGKIIKVQTFPDPKRAESIDAATFLTHAISWAGEFEDGAVLHGHPFMWIPLSNVATQIGRRRLTPSTFESLTGQKLVSMHARSGKPMLGVRLKLPEGDSTRHLSVNKLKRGVSGARGVEQTIPIFVGVASVNIRKRWDIHGQALAVRSELAAIYVRNMEELDG